MDDTRSSQTADGPLATAAGFVLIVGNPRSGSTLLGAAIDAHPLAVVANETEGSVNLWRTLPGPEILRTIYERARANAATGRLSEGYRYQIGPAPDVKPDIRLVGDKTWNPTILTLHGNPGLLPSLEERLCGFLGLPVVAEHRAAVARILFERPRRTAEAIPWTAAQRGVIMKRMADYEFLRRYDTDFPGRPGPDGGEREDAEEP